MNPKVDWFFQEASAWKAEYSALREILLGFALTEALKWGKPCYTLEDGRNVALIHGFKDYCAVLFFKGALLDDPKGILVAQSKNMQSQRQVRVTGTRQIARIAPALRACVKQAIALEQAGAKVTRKTTAEFEMPEEFARRLGQSAALTKAFAALTPGRQRGYLLHFGSAKQNATRDARIAKHEPRILAGKGLDD